MNGRKAKAIRNAIKDGNPLQKENRKYIYLNARPMGLATRVNQDARYKYLRAKELYNRGQARDVFKQLGVV